MSDMYADLAETASDLIAEFGQAATLRRKEGTYDAATGLTLVYSLSGLALTVNATAKTIASASGSWLTDGVQVGDVITFSGFLEAGNNAAFTVTDAAALVLTFAGASGLVDEVAADIAATSPERTTDYACDAMDNSPSSVALYSSSLAAGSLISEADRFFLVASAEAPQANDRLIVGTSTLTVHAVRPMAPGGVPVFYEVRARG